MSLQFRGDALANQGTILIIRGRLYNINYPSVDQEIFVASAVAISQKNMLNIHAERRNDFKMPPSVEEA